MQKWEYKVVVRQREIEREKNSYHDTGAWDNDIVAILKSLGAEGWELVAAWPRSDLGGQTTNFGGPIVGGVTTGEVWAFKRPA